MSAFIASSGRSVPTRTSTSPTVSLMRRMDPATDTRVMPQERTCSAMASPLRRASESSMRRPSPWTRPTPWRMFSSERSPKPANSLIRCPSAALFSSSRFVTPSSRYSRTAVRGPTSGTLITSASPGGNDRLSSSRSLEPPVSAISLIFWAMLFPTPGTSSSRPSSINNDMSRSRASTP